MNRDPIAELDPGLRVMLQTQKALDSLFPQYAAPVAAPKTLTDTEKVKRLRSALHGLLDLMASFEDVTLTRDLPPHQAESIYISEKENAYTVLRETA